MAAYNLPAPPTDINSLSYAYWRRQAWAQIAARTAQRAIRHRGSRLNAYAAETIGIIARENWAEAAKWHIEVIKRGGR